MLLNLREYQRPAAGDRAPQEALARALALLGRTGIHTVPLAGGDALLGSGDRSVEAVVDLQGLGLDEVAANGGRLRLGAMATRAALAQAGPLLAFSHGLLARAAASWAGSVQRNRATLGGAMAAAASNDPMVAALLACDAAVSLYDQTGERELSLADFLPQRQQILAVPSLILALTLTETVGDAREQSASGLAMVARTPADAPIVLACAAFSVADGCCRSARLVLGGIWPEPRRVRPAEDRLEGQVLSQELIQKVADAIPALTQPQADYRGSVEYRRAMAGVLSQRALLQAWEQAS
jgi:carbon-monoxide dehydrogenase medium subunit